MLLEAALAPSWPGEPPVVRSAMTCSDPLVEDVLPGLRAAGVTRLFVLPLYPQYSVTTTKGSFARVDESLAKMGWSPARVNAPDAWYSEPRFLDAHVARIEEAAARLPDPDPAATVLLYSAHSLPVSTIEKKKDPYPKQIEATVRADRRAARPALPLAPRLPVEARPDRLARPLDEPRSSPTSRAKGRSRSSSAPSRSSPTTSRRSTRSGCSSPTRPGRSASRPTPPWTA